MRAEEGFDPDGERVDLPAERRDASAGVFAEYGLTERLTLQFKGDWQDGRGAFVDYEGRGPLELGVTWQAWQAGWRTPLAGRETPASKGPIIALWRSF